MEKYGIPLYIIDGYNVILHGSFSGNRDIVRQKEFFLRGLDSYAAKKRVQMTIVWDGKPPPGSTRGGARVKNVYSGEGRSADDRIVAMVERSGHRKRMVVVSDDRKHIRHTVRALGARTMGVGEFLELIGYGHAKRRVKKNMHREETEKQVIDDLSVDEWLKIFRASGK
ncbi:MAG: NYN domain-containing protein [Spirochaetes bacterium]|nr:NYN domain-containing protein [Spirochaetota bacterium]